MKNNPEFNRFARYILKDYGEILPYYTLESIEQAILNSLTKRRISTVSCLGKEYFVDSIL